MIPFDLVRKHEIPALQATVEEYIEPGSGARHIHLVTNQADLAFLVAFPTIPDCNDGRAHILEHLTLSGSQRYPVRNPFFSMLRRSTASFMNAMTYADRTAYPFASTDRNDFFNLLDVYLDATFFPNLDHLNFLQEGWRYSLEDGKLGYQGVVLNEMKGAFTDPMRALHGGITAALLKNTTYAVCAGGDPLDIPDLSHQMLKDFHASHYHPSQAVFMSAGPIPAADIQQRISERVLVARTGTAPRRVPQLACVDSQRHATIAVPSQSARADGYGIQMAWLMGEAASPDVLYRSTLLGAGLLGDASAPLRKAMESAGYGRPGRLNGFDPGARQILFHLGMDGLHEEQVASARVLLWGALEQAAERGVPVAALQAALRDLTYRQRDTSCGQMPNILSRMLSVLPVALHGGDIISALDSGPALAQLRRDIEDPSYFKRLVRALLDNPARLDAKVESDPEYLAKRAALERRKLDGLHTTLGPAELERIGVDSAALQALQRQPADSSVLPRIKPGDVSPHPLPLPQLAAKGNGVYLCDIASNGISYARVQYDVSAFPEHDWAWLQLYAELRHELGVGDEGYEAAGAWRQRMVPGFAIGLEALADADGTPCLALNFYASGLREEHENIAAVLHAYVAQPRFDETERIAFLVQRMVRRRMDGLAQSGDRIAALAAAAPLAPLRRFEHAINGAGALPFLHALQDMAATPPGIAQLAACMAGVHARVTACARTVLCAGSGGDAETLAALLAVPSWDTGVADAVAAVATAATALFVNAALYAPSQVNHCNIAWPVPNQLHEDAPALAVAAELLSHQVLHQALREQGGAYGGRATYFGNVGVFAMNSYRDPRLVGTYADFDVAVTRLLDTVFGTEQLEEAIISVIKGLDKPRSPFDGALAAWHLQQRGIDSVALQRFRSGVLGCSMAGIKAAVARWLQNGKPNRVASVGNTAQNLDGLELVDLTRLGAVQAASA